MSATREAVQRRLSVDQFKGPFFTQRELESKFEGVLALVPMDQVRELEQRIEPTTGFLADYSGPLGEAGWDYSASIFPLPVLEAADDGVRFAPATARENPKHWCRITPAGKHEICKGAMYSKGEIVGTVSDKLVVIKGVDELEGKPPNDATLFMGITDEDYRWIHQAELEHLVDFSYAFKLVADRVAAAIQGLAGRSFADETEAVRALVDVLATDAPQLIPRNPLNLPSWEAHLRAATQHLAGKSKERDRRGTHSPTGRKATCKGDQIVLGMRFGATPLRTEDIIRLDGLDTVFSGTVAEPVSTDALVPGTRCRVKGQVHIRAFGSARADGAPTFEETTTAGKTEVVVEGAVDGGMVWVEWDGNPDANAIVDHYFESTGRAYFQVEVVELDPV